MQQIAEPDLSVIIVSHAHESMLRQCVTSLCPAFEGLAAELIVVDNLDRGQIGPCVENLPVPVRIISNVAPCGLARNVNQAAAFARGRYLLILNPDIRMHSGRWRDAIDFLGRNDSVGLLGCELLDPDGTRQQSFRQFPSLGVVALRALAVDRWPWRPRFYREAIMHEVSSDHPIEVGWVFGACLLLSRAVFDQVGGMDERFRLYYEDVDLCYRIRRSGLAIVLLPQIVLHHEHQRTSARRPFSQQWRWHAASLVRFFCKHRYLFKPRFVVTASTQRAMSQVWR
jgi:N-acetylglucosaminyl-diphospho-decaprenol L-rhamnosyltransferase